MCELSNLVALLSWMAGQLHLLAIKLATTSGPGITKNWSFLGHFWYHWGPWGVLWPLPTWRRSQASWFFSGSSLASPTKLFLFTLGNLPSQIKNGGVMLWPLLGYHLLPSLFIPQFVDTSMHMFNHDGQGMEWNFQEWEKGNERKGWEKEEWRGEEEHRCERVTSMKVADLGWSLTSLYLEIVSSILASCLFTRYHDNFVPQKYFFVLLRGKNIICKCCLKSCSPILLTPLRIFPHFR